MVPFRGRFYEFHMERIISRPGAPVFSKPGLEIGPELSREDALSRVKSGRHVYTLMKEDAYRLAAQAEHGRMTAEVHRPSRPTVSGREDVFYRHYHPGGRHLEGGDGPGHVFFGHRGEGLD